MKIVKIIAALLVMTGALSACNGTAGKQEKQVSDAEKTAARILDLLQRSQVVDADSSLILEAQRINDSVLAASHDEKELTQARQTQVQIYWFRGRTREALDAMGRTLMPNEADIQWLDYKITMNYIAGNMDSVKYFAAKAVKIAEGQSAHAPNEMEKLQSLNNELRFNMLLDEKEKALALLMQIDELSGSKMAQDFGQVYEARFKTYDALKESVETGRPPKLD